MKILVGEKTICYPLSKDDIPYFINLYCGQEKVAPETSNDIALVLLKQILSGNLVSWVVTSQEGRASKKLGVIFVLSSGKESAIVEGLIDNTAMDNMKRSYLRNRVSWIEDALDSVFELVFEALKKNRINVTVAGNNGFSKLLTQRMGFKKESVTLALSLTKDEYNKEK